MANVNSTSVRSSPSPLQLSYPPGTTSWILHDAFAICLGLALLMAWNSFVIRRGEITSADSLAKEAARLKTLSIGYPEGMRIFEELKWQRLLELRFNGLGLNVTWRAYPSASSLLHDLSNGSIDFSGGGATASIFSQGAQHLFARVAREKYPDLDADLILVPENSTISNLADLRGKRIAFDEGSSAHYVLVRCLESAGIEYGEIEPVLLAQQDALPLFREGLLDAWVVWMPYAATETRRCYPGRSLGSLKSLLGPDVGLEIPTLYYAIPELIRDYPRIVKAILEEVNEAGLLSLKRSLAELRGFLATGDHRVIDGDRISQSIRAIEARAQERSLVPLDDITLHHLQEQANRFYQLHLLRQRVNVYDVRYSIRARQNWTY